jgi:hypothetical protein
MLTDVLFVSKAKRHVCGVDSRPVRATRKCFLSTQVLGLFFGSKVAELQGGAITAGEFMDHFEGIKVRTLSSRLHLGVLFTRSACSTVQFTTCLVSVIHDLAEILLMNSQPPIRTASRNSHA